MDSSFLFSFCAPAVTFFMLLGTICFVFYRSRFHQENKIIAASSSSSSSALSLSSPQPSLSRNRKYHVFPSFHGVDVRKNFLSHIMKEFRSKGIDPFIDNDIERSKLIGPELIEAIKGSRIAVILLSRNYASSSWCMNELVEIMKCREELDQKVMTIFYGVDPTDVKKQTGDFGKAFRKTCKGKTNEEIKRWRDALEVVATIAGEHSSNWDNEADMIEKIVTDVSNMLNNSAPSRDFDGLVGMEAHMESMKQLLRLDLDEVRMIGIWGPSGIGKTTIARFLFNQLSRNFQLSVFMENIKELMYTRPICSDDYSTKLHLHKQLMSQITNHMDMEIPHLGVAQDRLNDKKVLIVLDSIDQSIQLDAFAKETHWFGHGSRIIITTQDQKLLKAHEINHIYKVDFPSVYEARQIFCTYAFGQKFPKDGFGELTWEVTKLLGELPLGLRVMGSYFRGMSKPEWANALPRLRTCLDSSIQSILKFSYDALCEEDKDLFLHIACFFNNQQMEQVEDCLAQDFRNVRHGLHVLAEKSLISISEEWIYMHNLLEQLGKAIVRHEPGRQSIQEPGKRQFLIDATDICEVLIDDTGSKSVIGIDLDLTELSGQLDISERAFEGMFNVRFLRFKCNGGQNVHKLCVPYGLNYLSRKLRFLEWHFFPMTCLPSNFCTKYLVELRMSHSKLQKLWEGNQPLEKLKRMSFFGSEDLKELPDLSTATSLQFLSLGYCKSLEELPPSIGNATNLQRLHLSNCTGLVELPYSIGNATNLQHLHVVNCCKLVELPSSIGNLRKLKRLTLIGCSKLKVLPTNINFEILEILDLRGCTLLKSFPEISTNITHLKLSHTAIKEVPSSIKSWFRLTNLEMSYNESLQEFPHALDTITSLDIFNKEMEEFPPWIRNIYCLRKLTLLGCEKLVSLPQLPDSLSYVRAESCRSLERLDCSFHNPKISLNFIKCFNLNKESWELIIQTSKASSELSVLPGGEVPAYFTYQATGRSMKVNLNQRCLSKTSRFKACIVLVNKGDKKKPAYVRASTMVTWRVEDRGVVVPCRPNQDLALGYSTAHLYIFEFEADVKSNELFFEFQVDYEDEVIEKCGVFQVPYVSETAMETE